MAEIIFAHNLEKDEAEDATVQAKSFMDNYRDIKRVVDKALLNDGSTPLLADLDANNYTVKGLKAAANTGEALAYGQKIKVSSIDIGDKTEFFNGIYLNQTLNQKINKTSLEYNSFVMEEADVNTPDDKLGVEIKAGSVVVSNKNGAVHVISNEEVVFSGLEVRGLVKDTLIVENGITSRGDLNVAQKATLADNVEVGKDLIVKGGIGVAGGYSYQSQAGSFNLVNNDGFSHFVFAYTSGTNYPPNSFIFVMNGANAYYAQNTSGGFNSQAPGTGDRGAVIRGWTVMLNLNGS